MPPGALCLEENDAVRGSGRLAARPPPRAALAMGFGGNGSRAIRHLPDPDADLFRLE